MRHHQVIVAIPARDEAASIRSCILSVDQAAAEVPLPVLVVVQLTAAEMHVALARDTGRSSAGSLSSKATGAAPEPRAAAVCHALDSLPDKAEPVWIANTDADCVVPTLWLRTQLELATDLDVVAGIVELDPESTAPAMFDAFTATTSSTGTTTAMCMAPTSESVPRVPGSGDGASRRWSVRTT
jgi:hypothetical protein